MDSLKSCLKVKQVKEQLNALPQGLENTYQQILVRSESPQDLYQMLHWLAFSARALRIYEIAEVVSVDLYAKGGPSYDPDSKYGNPRIAWYVCSGLVTETDGKSSNIVKWKMTDRKAIRHREACPLLCEGVPHV